MSTSITLEGFYRKAGKLIPWFMSAALVLFIVGVYLGFFVCPIEARQGNSYRIIFIHIPAAWLAMSLYLLMAVASIVGLLKNSRLAFILAQAYWVWDARLTSMLILFFLYLGFIALHSAIDDKRRADQAASVISIVGAVNVPIIYFSVRWWNTLHQGASITSSGSSIAPIMLNTIFIMLAAGTLYGAAVVLSRTRTMILERERKSDWAQKAALEGKL